MPDFDVTYRVWGTLKHRSGSITSRTEWSLHLAAGLMAVSCEQIETALV